MAVGITQAHANSTLDTMAAAYTYAQLHTNTGDPGAAGTSNVSSVTTRKALTWAAAASGTKAANGTLPSWPTWAGTNGEQIGYISFWNASTSGTFARSVQLSSPVTAYTGGTISITAITLSLVPLAA